MIVFQLRVWFISIFSVSHLAAVKQNVFKLFVLLPFLVLYILNSETTQSPFSIMTTDILAYFGHREMMQTQ